MKPRAVPTWLLRNLGLDDAVVGDLVEQYQSGRSTRWVWRQALIATFVMARKHAVLTIGAVVLGWAAVWLFFGFVGAQLARLDSYLIAKGLVEPYSAAWWLRGVVCGSWWDSRFWQAAGWWPRSLRGCRFCPS